MAFLLPLRSNSGFSGHTVWKGGAATGVIPVWHRPGGYVRVRRPSSHLCHGATGQRNSACVQKRSPKKLQKVTFSKPSFRTFFTAVMHALCTTFSSDSRVPQKAQKKFRNPQISELFLVRVSRFELEASWTPFIYKPFIHAGYEVFIGSRLVVAQVLEK